MPGALDGVKIVDVATGVAAAAAGMILADNGAEVIKVEPPGGEALRAWDASRVWHRGKESLVLDLEAEEGRAVLFRLLAGGDGFVETFRAGVAERLGLDYPTLAARFPRLVYCTLTGYVEEAENSEHAPYGELVEARLGLHSEQRGY